MSPHMAQLLSKSATVGIGNTFTNISRPQQTACGSHFCSTKNSTTENWPFLGPFEGGPVLGDRENGLGGKERRKLCWRLRFLWSKTVCQQMWKQRLFFVVVFGTFQRQWTKHPKDSRRTWQIPSTHSKKLVELAECHLFWPNYNISPT